MHGVAFTLLFTAGFLNSVVAYPHGLSVRWPNEDYENYHYEYVDWLPEENIVGIVAAVVTVAAVAVGVVFCCCLGWALTCVLCAQRHVNNRRAAPPAYIPAAGPLPTKDGSCYTVRIPEAGPLPTKDAMVA